MEDDIPRWEYTRTDDTGSADKELNKLGQEGWEAYAYNSRVGQTLLKRKVTHPQCKNSGYDYGR